MSFSLLPLHVSAGIVGILSGTAAMSFRKGRSGMATSEHPRRGKAGQACR